MADEQVTSALRALRKNAGVGVREMARRLGVSPNSYTHYENPDRFKEPYLPMAWAIRFADALEPSGVDRGAIIALAGADREEEASDLEARILQLSDRRQAMLLQLLSDLEAAEAVDRAHQETADGDAD